MPSDRHAQITVWQAGREMLNNVKTRGEVDRICENRSRHLVLGIPYSPPNLWAGLVFQAPQLETQVSAHPCHAASFVVHDEVNGDPLRQRAKDGLCRFHSQDSRPRSQRCRALLVRNISKL